MEFINATEISPLISHAYVKVCYVGQQPNRNGTVITKEVATEMGKKLPGSPVVGYYNKEEKDFEGHNREISIEDGKFEIIDTTKPYGFVPTNAKVWFQKFTDDGVEHEYLVTECYIWTGAYPESQRIIQQGNNQSMELDKKNQNGFWTNDNNSGKRIFIYNEALIEKLCILGENIEPCFEGAGFAQQFSLENSKEFQDFKATMFSMLTELQETLNKGGSQKLMEENDKILNPTEDAQETEFSCGGGSGGSDEKKKKEEHSAPQEEKKEEKKPEEEEDKKKEKYNLEEIVEYVELSQEYGNLQAKYSALEQEKATLEAEVTSLREFKLTAERQNKQIMIDSFYMLSDEDKKDVTENIDTYSLDDIESKLSVICVRNKLNLSEESEKDDGKPAGIFNLNEVEDSDNAPDWIKAVRNFQK